MANAKITGISAITGTTVVIRHATETDLIDVEGFLEDHHRSYNLTGAQVVVAVEGGRLVGVGILEIMGESGCVSIIEEQKRRGIGSSIVKHIMEYSPVKNVYVDVCRDDPPFARNDIAVGG